MKREDIVGKTMKMIQGPATEMDKIARLMVAMRQNRAFVSSHALCRSV